MCGILFPSLFLTALACLSPCAAKKIPLAPSVQIVTPAVNGKVVTPFTVSGTYADLAAGQSVVINVYDSGANPIKLIAGPITPAMNNGAFTTTISIPPTASVRVFAGVTGTTISDSVNGVTAAAPTVTISPFANPQSTQFTATGLCNLGVGQTVSYGLFTADGQCFYGPFEANTGTDENLGTVWAGSVTYPAGTYVFFAWVTDTTIIAGPIVVTMSNICGCEGEAEEVAPTVTILSPNANAVSQTQTFTVCGCGDCP